MFYITNENNQIFASDNFDTLTIFSSEIKELINVTHENYNSNKDKWSIDDNGVLNDISNTAAYKEKLAEQSKIAEKIQLQLQIEKLDKSRVRAICEPGIKDEATGQTWLEYYNLQIQNLRTQIAELE